MFMSSGSEKADQVHPARRDMAMKSMEMVKNNRDKCMAQMKAASDAMKK
jgi:hypothetical protein